MNDWQMRELLWGPMSMEVHAYFDKALAENMRAIADRADSFEGWLVPMRLSLPPTSPPEATDKR